MNNLSRTGEDFRCVYCGCFSTKLSTFPTLENGSKFEKLLFNAVNIKIAFVYTFSGMFFFTVVLTETLNFLSSSVWFFTSSLIYNELADPIIFGLASIFGLVLHVYLLIFCMRSVRYLIQAVKAA